MDRFRGWWILQILVCSTSCINYPRGVTRILRQMFGGCCLLLIAVRPPGAKTVRFFFLLPLLALRRSVRLSPLRSVCLDSLSFSQSWNSPQLACSLSSLSAACLSRHLPAQVVTWRSFSDAVSGARGETMRWTLNKWRRWLHVWWNALPEPEPGRSLSSELLQNSQRGLISIWQNPSRSVLHFHHCSRLASWGAERPVTVDFCLHVAGVCCTVMRGRRHPV